MELRRVLWDLRLKQVTVVTYVNQTNQARILDQSTMSKIVNHQQNASEIQRICLQQALVYFGLSDKNVFKIKELQLKKEKVKNAATYNNW